MFPESSSRVTADGVVGLTRALLAAGVQCVCVSQWPVPAAAARLFTQAFYGALLAGTRASAALTDAMKTVQSSPLFSHPTHWAGYMLIGCDVKLNSPKSMIGQALTEILQCPDRARDALRVLLHLVEKSLQRIQSGQCNPMYTSLQSIENKVGGVPGWQALLSAVGFRSEGSLGGGPGGLSATSAVFFPTMDPGNRLQLCSTTLQALLGLPPTALLALCRLVTESESGEQLISKLHQVLAQLQSGDKEQDFSLVPIQVSISVQLWRLPGCHEFLAALGFDLCEVGQEEVVLKTGKQASRRTMHFALNSLLGFFDASELPKRQSMDSSSSLESLSSSQCTSSSLAQSIPPALGCHQSAPPYPDTLSCDAISVYSLSSLASSLSFLSRPEPAGSDIISPQDLDRQRAGGVGAAGGGGGRSDGLSLGRLGGRGGAAGGRPGGEEYDGFSIISSEPLRGAAGGGRDCGTLSLPGGHKHSRGGAGRGGASVSSRGSVSTPTSPVKAPSTAMKTSSSPTPGPSLSSPLRKGKLCSSESDQSSTETDSTIKSQEERVPTALLDPQELAQKILQETQSHLEAVDHLQKLSTARGPPCVRPEGKRAARGGSLSSPATAPSSPCRTPTGGGAGRGFCPSVTSAFSRPESRASLRACASPLPPSAPPLTQPPPPPPPPRPRNTARLSSCSTSSVSSPDRRSAHSSPAASRSPSLSSSLKDHVSLSPLSSPSSPPPPHSEARRAPRWRTSDTSPSCSSADLSLSPLGGAASPIASHSSGGSVSASPSPTARGGPRPRPRGTPPPDDSVPSVRSLKTFWANVSQKAAGSRPERPLAGEDSSRMSVVQQDVLGLLHLSPRQERTAGNRTAGTQASGQGRKAAPLSTSQNPVRKSYDAGSRVNSCPENHPSENGYKEISTGKFYPSSKC